ncbi:MAG: hypothetical protein AAF998_19330 [Bacteroidota bacterium]
MAKYSIFGAGPGGLYTAWRLVSSGKLTSEDTLNLYDWGKYAFTSDDRGTREPAGRICTYHYRGNPENSYIEVGGMRYIEWDGQPDGDGHRLVTWTIDQLGLTGESEPFNTTSDPLFYLRQKNFYSSQISSFAPAPYNANRFNATNPPDDAIAEVSTDATGNQQIKTRAQQCNFYQNGTIPESLKSSVYRTGDPLKNIGYWNLLIDQLGTEGYEYAAAGGGYNSNVINWNAADALVYNGEFAPGGSFKTLKDGYSSLFAALFTAIQEACASQEIAFHYHPHTRLRSIYLDKNNNNAITFTLGRFGEKFRQFGPVRTTDFAWLAMPPGSLEIVAEGSRYQEGPIIDVLNQKQVALYRESVLLQPSYKVAMFFKNQWWKGEGEDNDIRYMPKLNGIDQEGNAIPNVFGPTITDLPIRQIYYFGDNHPGAGLPAADDPQTKVYGILASYDDERFVRFWQEMEVSVHKLRTEPLSWLTQPLVGPQEATPEMVRMLREQLAEVHWGPGSSIDKVPHPLQTVFMDWSQKPFRAGYHAWAAHYDIGDVMQRIRKPTLLLNDDATNANLFIVGSAYSNDQAWVEGAFCTAESVLEDFLGVATPEVNANPINDQYPFICG